ncbi:MAG: geranylgeranyl reductase family protein [Bacteroidota bacterium]
MNKGNLYDVIIAGGGPAGSACALCLAHSGLKIAMIDKASFPRNKICGDALSIDVIRQLPKLSEKLSEKFNKIENKISSRGLRIYGPSGELLELFIKSRDNSCGYVLKRPVFDNMFHECLAENPSIKFFENCRAETVKRYDDHILLITSSGELKGKIIIGADGANSVISRHVQRHIKLKKHLCIGIKSYYKNVEGFHADGCIELHFYKNLLPCYFWIFPMHSNEANVGLGLMHQDLLKSKHSLKKIMSEIIAEHPAVSPRFKNAQLISAAEAWPLPLAMDKKVISGERILLAGDAAGLIDPYTGEGVGNAIRSGRIAADHISNCFKENNFSASFNQLYDKEIYRRMWKELRINRSIQKILKYPKLIDYIIRKANKSNSFKNMLLLAIENDAAKEKMVKNLFLKK